MSDKSFGLCLSLPLIPMFDLCFRSCKRKETSAAGISGVSHQAGDHELSFGCDTF